MKVWFVMSLMLSLVLDMVQGAENSPKSGFSLLVGYQGLELEGTAVRHPAYTWNRVNTGSSMSSLPGPNTTTSLDGGISSFAVVGMRYEMALSQHWGLNLDAGGLIAPAHRDEHSTSSPDNSGSRWYASHGPVCSVYSESRYGAFGGIGLTYHFGDRLYVGIDARLTGVIVDSGWVWKGKDYRTSTDVPVFLSGGPRIGYKLLDRLNVESYVHFGKTFNCGMQFVIPFGKK